MLRFVTAALLLSVAVSGQNITYDYVIAGSGTAGLLLAVVLSENSDTSVMVLEAGGDARGGNNVTDPERRGMKIGIAQSKLTIRPRHDSTYDV